MTTRRPVSQAAHVHGPGCDHDHGHGPAHDHDEHGHAGETYVRAEPKTQRNDPCPCGSGKKYKKCHDPKG